MNINYDNYNEIVAMYDDLADNDPQTAFVVMKKASGEKEYFDCLIAEWNKIMIDAEKEAKGVEAQITHEYRSNGNGVKDAENLATFEMRTLSAWKGYSAARKMRDLLAAQANRLERIYFDAKAIWESAYKKFGKIV